MSRTFTYASNLSQTEEEAPKKRVTTPQWTASGERIRPVHKPAKKTQCQWVTGIGWVYNPTRRWINRGEA